MGKTRERERVTLGVHTCSVNTTSISGIGDIGESTANPRVMKVPSYPPSIITVSSLYAWQSSV